MRSIIILLAVWGGVNLPVCTFAIKTEMQAYYDERLCDVLMIVMDNISTFPPDSKNLIADKSKFRPKYGQKYDIGEEISSRSRSAESYLYFIEAVSSRGIKIRAKNKYGGRSYIYDYEWNVVSYVFRESQEERQVARTVIDWITTEKYPDPPKGSEWRSIVTALGYRGCYTGGMLDCDNAKFDILGSFGCFLAYDELRPQVWAVVLGGKVYADDAGREKCIRGILSNYESYSPKLQKEVLVNVAKYLESADDEIAKYSKKIAEFIIAKGGSVPDRLYRAYDTSWVPIEGGTKKCMKSDVRYKAGASPAKKKVTGKGVSH